MNRDIEQVDINIPPLGEAWRSADEESEPEKNLAEIVWVAWNTPKTGVDEFAGVSWVATKLAFLVICHNFSSKTHYPHCPAKPILSIQSRLSFL